MAAYGFVAGLPLPLSTFTLRYWLSESGATLSMIGLTANIGLAYSLKFLWSPLFDHVVPPGAARRLGQRRGWLVIVQPALILAARARHALADPLKDFLTRPGAILTLVFVALFKLGEAMAGIMTAPFYRALGFSREVIAGAGPFSLVATLTGIMAGGWLVARVGVGRALLWTGAAQTIAMGLYEALAHAHGLVPMLYLTVATEAFAQGMADAAFLTFLSGLCARAFAATHYALLSSVPMLAIHTLGGFSGYLAGVLGWSGFYGLCIFAALPAMGLMVVLLRRYPPE